MRVENEGLRRDLDNMRNMEDVNQQLKTQYEDERQMRINSEGDISRLREQLADSMSTGATECPIMSNFWRSITCFAHRTSIPSSVITVRLQSGGQDQTRRELRYDA